MRSYVKILCLLCALLMVVSCFTACKVKVKPESLTDKDALTEYEKLKNNMDKLFYFADEKHPAASNVTSIIGEIEMPEADVEINKLEASVAASLDKLTLGGADYLQQLGGPVKLNGSVITGEAGINFDLGATISGLTIDFDAAMDKDGISITSPFMFTKPVYVSLESIRKISAEASDAPAVDGNAIVEAFEKWYNEKFTEENRKHIADLFKGCIPAEAITVSKATPAELKGVFITFDSETECVTLTITEAVAKQIASNVKTKLASDEVIKDMVISFANCLGEDLLKEMTGKTAEELYNDLIKALTEGESGISTMAITPVEALTVSGEESDASADAEENGVIIVNRYFAGGHPVKTDVVVKDAEKEYFNFTAWDAYANTNAREYGMKLSVEGKEYVSLIGGANKTTAEMNAVISFTEEGISINENEATEETKDAGKLTISASRNENGVNVNGTFDMQEENTKATFEYNETAETTTVKAEVATNEFTAKLNYNKAASGTTFKLEAKAADVNVNVDYSNVEAGATFKASFADDAGDNGLTLDGTKTVSGNKTVYNADIVVKEEGEEAGKINLNCENTTTVTDTKTESDIKLTAFSEGLLDVGASIKLVWDTNTDKVPVAPTKDGAFEIKGESDLEGIADIMTDMFKGMMGE